MSGSQYVRFIKNSLRKFITGDFKISLARLEPVHMLIWEEAPTAFKEVLAPESYFIVNNTPSTLYLHPSIVWKTLSRARFRRDGQFESIIKACQPNVVVTHIDNDPRFHRMAAKFPTVPFVAFQNGVRGLQYSDDLDYPFPLGPPQEYESIYFCFGQNEVDAFATMGYKFKEIRAVGSIKNEASFYRSMAPTRDDNTPHPNLDLILISQFRPALLEADPGQALSEYDQVASLFSSHSRRYPDLQIGIAMRFGIQDINYDAEVRYHQRHFGSNVNAILIPRSSDGMSNYLVTHLADVVVAASSSLSFEILGRGHKTLICCRPLYEEFKDQSFLPDWVLPSLKQEMFDKVITQLRLMTPEKFLSRNGTAITYFMKSPSQHLISKNFRDVLS